jgi:hypothetical protein
VLVLALFLLRKLVSISFPILLSFQKQRHSKLLVSSFLSTMRAALDEVDKLAKKASLFPESCRSENMANLVDAMASLAVRKSEISNRNITGKTSNSILRDCTVKACTLTRCELYNCTIQESRFFDSEIYECDFVTTGTHIRRYALTRCKIYSCRLVPYLDISNSEMHDSTISSYGFEKSQDAVDRTTGFGGLLPKGPSISRSELYRCVITWPSDTNKGDNGIAICKLFDCTLENPTIRRSKLRRCKITRSTLVYSGDNNNTTQAVEKSTLIACDIRRTCAYQCIMLECKLKYVVAWESHFEGCTIRKSGIVLSSTPPITVSKARENFPDIQAKYPEIDDDQSINFLAHLPLEIKARIMQYVAGSLKLKGGTPPLIEAVRGNHLLYSSALSAFAKKNWHSVRAANDNELTDERILSMKDWQDVRKLAIR